MGLLVGFYPRYSWVLPYIPLLPPEESIHQGSWKDKISRGYGFGLGRNVSLGGRTDSVPPRDFIWWQSVSIEIRRSNLHDCYWTTSPGSFRILRGLCPTGVVLRKIRGVTLVLIGTFLFGMLYYSTAVLWPQQVQVLYTQNLISVGWYGSALGMAAIPTSVLTGILFGRLGHARIMFTVIIAVGTIGAGLMALVSPGSSTASTIFVALIGVCTGGGFVVAAAMIRLAVEHEYIGIGTALCVTARNVGGSVATVVYTAISTNRLKHYVTGYIVGPLLTAGVVPTSLASATLALLGQAPKSALRGLTPEQIGIGLHGVKESYAQALRIVYLSSIGFGVVGTICVAFCKNCDDKMTNQVNIRLNEGAKFIGITDEGKGHIISIEEQEKLRHRY